MTRAIATVVVTMLLGLSTSFAEDLRPTRTLNREGDWQLSFAAGASHSKTPSADGAAGPVSELEPSWLLSLRYGITDRLQIDLHSPSMAYQWGTSGGTEWIPWAGLTSWGAGFSSIEGMIFTGKIGGGLGIREWRSSDTAVNATAKLSSSFRLASKEVCTTQGCQEGDRAPSTWGAQLSLGLSHRVGRNIQLNFGLAVEQNLVVRGSRPMGALDDPERAARILAGSVQMVGLRSLPLVQVQLNRQWALDGYAGVFYSLASEKMNQTYLLGLSRSWL